MFRIRNIMRIYLQIVCILLFWTNISAIKWLAAHKARHKTWNHSMNCTKSLGLVSTQVKICRKHLDVMGTVSHAARIAIDTCQNQFADRRWNCSAVSFVPRLTRDLSRGTREQAYVYAIASAALVHNVARACSVGLTSKCSCGVLPNSPPSGSFTWGGCGDDVRFGIYFGEQFSDASLMKKGTKILKSSKKAGMNRHNNQAGRKVVADSLTTACKCHGVSGSCSVKTCWRSLPDFNAIGATLKNRYALAVEVVRKRRKKQKRFIPINRNIQQIRADELVYYTKSPDYCSPNAKTGSIGTQGRYCDKDKNGPGGCDAMCCGRGYKSMVVEVQERCECKYYWCCYVKCKTCSKTLHLNRCS